MAEVYDESGINISDAGIGHQMTITLDDKTVYTDVSSYFQPALGEFGRGFIAYPLSGLSEGEHSLRLKSVGHRKQFVGNRNRLYGKGRIKTCYL